MVGKLEKLEGKIVEKWQTKWRPIDKMAANRQNGGQYGRQ